ncbi:Phytochelatin synthase-domain-containing protein [Pilobolus umbonatus]|nr:Phytochelatin synthase-domain-containing protein [Pilobolus umbonatus]
MYTTDGLGNIIFSLNIHIDVAVGGYIYVNRSNNHNRDNIHLVKFTSVEGKRLFRNALVEGHTESFFKLMGNFSHQSTPSQAGVSSLAMVLNALEIDPKRTWKGNWRWYSLDQMQTCSSDKSIKERGMPFDEFTCLAQSHCYVVPHRGGSYEKFIADLEKTTANSNSQMVVNYSRISLGQQEDVSHFSPIGGFNKEENQVLIMDVACGKYPSVWVNAKHLYNAMMKPSQEEHGLSRGYFILSNELPIPNASRPSLSMAKLKCQDCSRQCQSKK